MKCKIFTGNDVRRIEKEINIFLKSCIKIEIVNIVQSQSTIHLVTHLVISIFYS